MKRVVYCILITIVFLFTIGCATSSESGLLIGAGAGGVIGGAIGSASGNTATGVLVGAIIGGTAGAIIGDYMDRQAAEIEKDIEGAKVERIAEGIKITFDSGILFQFDKSDITAESQKNIAELARILNKYKDTEVLVEGHTDAVGTDEYNLELSEKRAQSVKNSLVTSRVKASRIITMGYGESQPVTSNDTVEGRSQNRRVEIAIYANDKLKKAARKQAEEQG